MSAQTHADHHPDHHPGPKTYAVIAVVLCIITFIEFVAFYQEWLQFVLVPLLVVLSAIKFLLVVMFYMHIKFDHVIFKSILITGICLGFGVMLWLLALFVYSHPIEPI